MDIELGANKAAALREVLPSRPCSVTGKTDEDLLEYAVPIKWERLSEADFRRFGLQAKQEAAESDLSMLDDFFKGGAGEGNEPGSGSGSVQTKQEPLTEAEKQKNQFDEFNATITQTLRKYSDMQTQATLIMPGLQKKKYQEGAQEQLKKHQVRVFSVIKILTKALSTPVKSA